MDFREWLEKDAELYSEVNWKSLGRNAAMAGALMGAGAGINSMTGSNQSQQVNPTQQSQQSNIDSSTGVYHSQDGVKSVEIAMNPKVAKARALSNLAKFLGTSQIPPGIDVQIENRPDGSYRAVCTYSKQRSDIAAQTAWQMSQ